MAESPVILYTHESGREHDTGPGHPERPERLDAVDRAAQAAEQAGQAIRHDAPAAGEADILACHTQAHLDRIIRAVPGSGLAHLDGDTVVSPGSARAMWHSAGGAIAAAKAALARPNGRAASACRPPGHHAEPERAMGFCLVDNIALAARYAQQAGGCRRVAIVDFDVHHGNGTQAIAWDDPGFFYASTHQMPLFPGTGAAEETGAHGQIVNSPLPAFSAGAAFREAMDATILPALRQFAPELVLISAGFDADGRDPLAQLQLGPSDFGWATARLVEAARESAQGRVASVLEGGYDLTALEEGLGAHLAALAET